MITLKMRNGRWSSPIDYLKWGQTRSRVHRRVVAPLCPMKISTPFCRLLMNKGLQVLLECSVDHLGLPICLRVIGGAHTQLGTLQLEELMPESAQKNGIPVRNEASQGTMKLAYCLGKHSGNPGGGITLWKWGKACCLRKAVDNHQNGRVPME